MKRDQKGREFSALDEEMGEFASCPFNIRSWLFCSDEGDHNEKNVAADEKPMMTEDCSTPY